MIQEQFATNIQLKFGELAPIITWCKINCKNKWHYDVIDNAGREMGEYKFIFEGNTDYVNFILWKK